MEQKGHEIIPVTIEDELKQSYLDYAMSVIIGRALPDVRDGLKPVHRRVLYAMHGLHNDYNKPYKKSARIVGEVIGKYHPHGDTAVYDTMVRMAQPFSLRYLLVDGQGNFGSVDGDAPAAMRYTEVRMTRMAHALLEDLEKETVNFYPNYDESEVIPEVLPTRVPNLLVNGSSGIAVGMATNIPPHNLNEVVDACLALIKDPDLSIDQLMEYIPGPDFPTAGIINGRAGIVSAYRTGRGRIYVRAKADVESSEKGGGKEAIIITELPYQVNKARLQEKIAELVKTKRIDGITGIRDESDKDGMRVVIEIRRGENAEVILNNLYKLTQLETVFGINLVALEENKPQIFNLKELVECFIRHRREVVTRRTIFELRKAREKAHLLEGLSIALANIDEMIALIKASPTPAEAKEKMLAKQWAAGQVVNMLEKAGGDNAAKPADLLPEFGLKDGQYRLSPAQAQAILDMRLHRLTGLEQDKIFADYEELLKKIAELMKILADPARLLEVICEELEDIKKRFGDDRRTEIIESQQDLTSEDLIPEEDVVVTVSHHGYAKTQTLDTYQAQRRGGKGKTATKVKEEDYVQHLLIANSHDTLLCFSSLGKVYWLKTYQIPQAGRASRGRPMVNLLPLAKHERISAMLSISEFVEDKFVFMATEQGTVKKVALSQFSRPRASGIIAVGLSDEDRLVDVEITNGEREIMLFSDAGKVIRFHEEHVRPMGRSARGVRGIKLQDDQKVVSMVIVRNHGEVLTATRNGYGKRTNIDQYRVSGRGAQGVISIQINDRNGPVVGAIQVEQNDETMLISDQGVLVRIRVSDISSMGRNTQGVRLINLSKGEHLVGLQRIEADDDLQPTEEFDA